MLKWRFISLQCAVCGRSMIAKETKNSKCRYVCAGHPECSNKMYAEMFDKILKAANKLIEKNPDIIENLTGVKWKGSVLGQCYSIEITRHMPTRITVSVQELKKRVLL